MAAPNLYMPQNAVVLGWNSNHTYFMVLECDYKDISPSASNRILQLECPLYALTPFAAMATDTAVDTVINASIRFYRRPNYSPEAVWGTANKSLAFSDFSGRANVVSGARTFDSQPFNDESIVSWDIETENDSWTGSVNLVSVLTGRRTKPYLIDASKVTFSINGNTAPGNADPRPQLVFGESASVSVISAAYIENYMWFKVTGNPESGSGNGNVVLAKNIPMNTTGNYTLALSEIAKLSNSVTASNATMILHGYRGETIENYYPATDEAVQKIEALFNTGYTASMNIAMKLVVPASVIPAISNVAISEAAQGFPAAITSYVQRRSMLRVAITASGLYGATISGIRTTVSGYTYTGATFTTNILTQSGTLTMSISATDSRGRTRTVTRQITVTAYSPPSITGAELYRCAGASDDTADTDGAFGCIVPKGAVSPVNNQNVITCKIYYKKVSDSWYSSATVVCQDYTLDTEHFIFAADIGSGYDVYITLADLFEEVRYYCVPLPATGALIHIKQNRRGMGIFQRAPAGEDGIWIAGDVHLTGMQYEVATLATGSLDGQFKDLAPSQFGVNSVGQGIYIPLKTYKLGNVYLTLCIDTENQQFGVYKYDADLYSGTFTPF